MIKMFPQQIYFVEITYKYFISTYPKFAIGIQIYESATYL